MRTEEAAVPQPTRRRTGASEFQPSSIMLTRRLSLLSRKTGLRSLKTYAFGPESPKASFILLPDPLYSHPETYHNFFKTINSYFLHMIALDVPPGDTEEYRSWKPESKCSQFISDLVHQENQRYPASCQVYLGGFGEGGNAAVKFGLMQERLAGIAVFALKEELSASILELARRPREGPPLRIRAYQGAKDDVFSPAKAEAEWRKLAEIGDGKFKIEMQEIEGVGHASAVDEYLNVIKWISEGISSTELRGQMQVLDSMPNLVQLPAKPVQEPPEKYVPLQTRDPE